MVNIDRTRRAHALAGSRLGPALAALGVAVVLAAVVMAAVSLIGGPSGSSRGAPAAADAPVMPREIQAERLGVTLQLPAGWRRQPGKDVLRFVAPGGDLAVSLAAVAPTFSRIDVRRDTLAALQRDYEGVRVLKTGEASVGAGLEALTAEVSGRKTDGTPIRALVASVRSSWRTYAVTVFSTAAPSRKHSVETALMLRSLQLSEPRS